MSPTDDLERLIQALRDNDPNIQTDAENQLRRNFFDKGLDSSLGDSLIQALKDSDSDVRTRAEEYLRRFSAQSDLQKEQSRKFNCNTGEEIATLVRK